MQTSSLTVTMADIAREVGVSQPTVSRALQNHPNVREDVRIRVQQAAAKLNYKPNSLVSALMASLRGRSPARAVTTIGFISDHPTRDGWRDTLELAEFFEGAKARAESKGYRVEHFWTREQGMSARRLSQILYAQGISALLIAPLPRSHGHMSLDWAKFTSVALGYSMARPAVSRTMNDQDQTTLLILRSLKRLGYRKLGLALDAFSDHHADHRWTNRYLALRSDFPGLTMLDPFSPPEVTEAGVLEWFCGARPEVIIASDLRIIEWLRNAGYRLPQDVGFARISVGGNEGNISGANQNFRLVGEAAVDMIVGQLNRNERGIPEMPKLTLIPATWVNGTTVQDRRRTVEGKRYAEHLYRRGS